jgi:glycosyltransferase involved in cell wall biosynthesis
MIRRIVVINDSSVAKGGATGLALASALAFRKRGLAVTLLTGDQGANPELTDAGVEVVALGQDRLMSSPMHQVLFSALYNRAAKDMVSGWIAANDAPGTVYHLHGWAQILSPSVFQALKPVAGRLVLSAHDFFLVCPNGAYAFLNSGAVCPLTPMSAACIGSNCDRRSYAHKLWRVARQAVRQSVFDLKRHAPPVLAIHESMRSYLVRGGMPDAAVQTLPNPVRAFLTERAPAEDNREFLFIGRLEDGKGPDLAAAAARRAGVQLRIIGDGPMREALERQYPEVIFSGRKSWEEIGPLARQARALLMPSRYPEPYGLVAAEALWSGLPVIAAETAFLAPDIVAAGAGFACDPRDEEALAQAMRRLMDDDLARTFSVNAFENTRSIGLSPEAWVDGLLSAYENRLGPVRSEDVAA